MFSPQADGKVHYLRETRKEPLAACEVSLLYAPASMVTACRDSRILQKQAVIVEHKTNKPGLSCSSISKSSFPSPSASGAACGLATLLTPQAAFESLPFHCEVLKTSASKPRDARALQAAQAAAATAAEARRLDFSSEKVCGGKFRV